MHRTKGTTENLTTTKEYKLHKSLQFRLLTNFRKKDIFVDNKTKYCKTLDKNNHKVKFEYVEGNNNKSINNTTQT